MREQAQRMIVVVVVVVVMAVKGVATMANSVSCAIKKAIVGMHIYWESFENRVYSDFGHNPFLQLEVYVNN